MPPHGSSDKILPFAISVPDSELADLRERLTKARWAAEPIGGAEGYGASRAWVTELVEYWRNAYDWRVWEQRLNQHPQFKNDDRPSERALSPRSLAGAARVAVDPQSWLAWLRGRISRCDRTVERAENMASILRSHSTW
jgi:hypothetical protein